MTIWSLVLHIAALLALLFIVLAEEADRLIIKFVGHQNAKRIRRALLFSELSIPGGYRLGERVYWCGSLSENVKSLHAKPADTFFQFSMCLLCWFGLVLLLTKIWTWVVPRKDFGWNPFLSFSLSLFLSFFLSFFLLSFFPYFFLSFSLFFFLAQSLSVKVLQ